MSLSVSPALKPHLCPFSSWSKEHERTATLPLSFSFFTQRLWLCVIRRCDTFPVAHRYLLPSWELWHAARRPTCLRGHNRGMLCEDLLSSPARFYTPAATCAPANPTGSSGADLQWLILAFILTVCRHIIKASVLCGAVYLIIIFTLSSHCVLILFLDLDPVWFSFTVPYVA